MSYIPVNCEFHDYLEEFAMRRKQVSVHFFSEDGAARQRDAVITDVFAREGADYMTLSSGELIRLDRLVSVDGIELAAFPASCAMPSSAP